MDLKDKVIVITGAGNGVGRELAMQMLARGAIIACVDVDSRGLEETLRIAGPQNGRTASMPLGGKTTLMELGD